MKNKYNKGKVIIVVGASQGIGREIALELAKESHTLILASRNLRKLRETAEIIKGNASDVLPIKLDIQDERQIAQMVKKTYDRYGKIDALVNCAGYVEPVAVMEMTVQNWDKTLDTNLRGPFLTTREVLRYMKNTGGKIVNVASTSGLTPRPGWSAYAASKAGLINFSLTMAEELKSYHIKIYCVAPGRTATALRKKLAPEEDPTKVMPPQSVAKIVSLLISDLGDFLDQQTIIVRKQLFD